MKVVEVAEFDTDGHLARREFDLRVNARNFLFHLARRIHLRAGLGRGKVGYPSRPGRHSHHPLIAFLAEAPLVLHVWLRCGNTSSARGAAAFLTEAFALMPAHWTLRTVRADSGFFENGLLTFIEALGISYIVVKNRFLEEIQTTS